MLNRAQIYRLQGNNAAALDSLNTAIKYCTEPQPSNTHVARQACTFIVYECFIILICIINETT